MQRYCVSISTPPTSLNPNSMGQQLSYNKLFIQNHERSPFLAYPASGHGEVIVRDHTWAA